MKKLIFQSGVLLLLLALMSTGHAKPDRRIPVFCGQGQSIQDALALGVQKISQLAA